MPAFDFLPLVWWGLPLAAAPILIHLINLLRHRRVPWAAMEFLLASQKKYRTRVLLKQLLLLALRTAAIVGIVLALAQPRWRAALGGMFGAGARHLLLLDDSISMGDLTPDAAGRAGPAFDRGRRVVERIAADLAAQSSASLGVGLFSEFGSAGTLAVGRESLNLDAARLLRDEIARLRVSWSASGPAESLARAAAEGGEANRTVWIVSDFRARDWRGGEIVESLRQLADAGAQLRLVDCGVDPPPAGNLTIERIEAVGGVPAAGVLMPVEVSIRNDGTSVARDVLVELREDSGSRPTVRIAEIPAGGSVTRRFDTRFSDVGGHVVEARLPADILPADNTRACVIDIVDRIDVLLVADDPGRSGRDGDAFYVAAALAPGAGAPTGLAPRIEPPSALAAMDLSPYDCIWLLDVERLDASAIAALEAHVKAGASAVFFCGPQTQADTINRSLYRDGEGLFPVPLAGAVEVLPAPGPGRVPDIAVEDHPVVAVLSGQRNPLLDAVRLDRVMAVERGFDEGPSNSKGLRRLLSLRTGGPLAVERPFGKGLVAAVLTTAAPTWNTWARGNPSWVVVMLELQNHLAANRRRGESLVVPDEMVVRLEPGVDEAEVEFLVPPDSAVVRQGAKPVDGRLETRLLADIPGVYAARWRSLDGRERERVVAANIDPAAGRLERLSRDQLDRALVGIPFRYDRAESLEPDTDLLAGLPLAQPLLVALLVILIAEQCVAFAASYHASPSPRGRR
jgi:hypothetical protein